MNGSLTFIFPLDGDMLNGYDGQETEQALEITARVSAPKGSVITINGFPAAFDGAAFQAKVSLTERDNTLTARAQNGGQQQIRVYWLKNSTGKFRVSVDDNIHFLKDLARNADRYTSIFDNAYLRVYREAHERYQAKVHLNVFYQEDGFDLSMMPLKYKSEFKEVSSWLRMQFHAEQEFPDKPYQFASYATVKRDYERIAEQLRRFAGYEDLAPTTTVHWGELNREGGRALHDCGLRCLMGYFQKMDDRWIVSYYLNEQQCEHMAGRDFWMDHESGMTFGHIKRVMNIGPKSGIIPDLEQACRNPHTAGFMEVMIHEQYFYPDYMNYLPDFRERILDTLEWITAAGYKPAWVSDAIGI
ncbi:MAG: hypothetical protein VB070_08820 [Clostridiaceae bacterium]|nr:hypothetical protein [Clostridiaceae bacterium]